MIYGVTALSIDNCVYGEYGNNGQVNCLIWSMGYAEVLHNRR